MKLKHKCLVPFIILEIVCLSLALYFYINPAEIKINSKNDVKKYIEKLNAFVLKGKTNDEYNRVLKYKIDEELIMLGKDAYQNQQPSKEIVKKYKLEKYANEHKKLIKNLEEKIKNNFEVNIKKIQSDDMFKTNITIKTFYYLSYISDLMSLEGDILSKVGIRFDKELSEKEQADKYKAKVKSMQIMDKYLDRYTNKDETISISLYFIDEQSSKCINEIKWYLTNLAGDNYPKAPVYDAKVIDEYASKVDSKNVLEL